MKNFKKIKNALSIALLPFAFVACGTSQIEDTSENVEVKEPITINETNIKSNYVMYTINNTQGSTMNAELYAVAYDQKDTCEMVLYYGMKGESTPFHKEITLNVELAVDASLSIIVKCKGNSFLDTFFVESINN